MYSPPLNQNASFSASFILEAMKATLSWISLPGPVPLARWRSALVEQMDYLETTTIPRLEKVINGEQGGISKAVDWQGGGSVVTCELMKRNARYMDQIQTAQSADELAVLWETMQKQAFLSYKVDFDHFDEHAEEFAQLSLADQKRFLLQVLDKNQLYVNLSEIDDADYHVSEEDKRLNRQFYCRSDCQSDLRDA